MCRFESKALNDAESESATERVRTAGDALFSASTRFMRCAIGRRGGNPSVVSDSAESREKMRTELKRLANFASE